jgi:hypothetical protein
VQSLTKIFETLTHLGIATTTIRRKIARHIDIVCPDLIGQRHDYIDWITMAIHQSPTH